MACRSLTSKYELFRGQSQRDGTRRRNESTASPSLSTSGTSASTDSFSNQGLLQDGQFNDSGSGALGVSSLPPKWVDILDQVKKDMIKVKDSIRSLTVLHARRLQISFGNEAATQEQERDIEILTQEITRLLRDSEKNVKRIASIGVGGGHGQARMADTDRVSRLNVMRGLASELQEQSRRFRQLQKTFLNNLKTQESLGSSFDSSSSSSDVESVSDGGAFDDSSLSEGQLVQLRALNQRSGDRYQDIVKIAQSINDLSSLFQELNVLVIEQGSLLDRIDYNIEQTTRHVERANQELTAADGYSKRSLTMKCLCIMLILVVILLSIYIYKKTK